MQGGYEAALNSRMRPLVAAPLQGKLESSWQPRSRGGNTFELTVGQE